MFDFSPDAGLIGLAASAFLSATLLPGNSEIVLVGVLAKYSQLSWPAIAVATIANTLGGMTSYLIGRIVPNKVEGKGVAQTLRRMGAAVVLGAVDRRRAVRRRRMGSRQALAGDVDDGAGEIRALYCCCRRLGVVGVNLVCLTFI